MNNTTVYLSTPGIVCPLGITLTQVAEALFAGDQSGLHRRATGLNAQQQFCGVVKTELPTVPDHLSFYACRNNQLLIAATESIRAEIEQVINQFGSGRVAVIVGSSTSGIAEGGVAIAHWQQHQFFPPHYDYRQQEIGTPAEFLAQYWTLTGPTYTISTACTSSTKAFASARRLLRANLVDAVLLAGADSLCSLTLNGFAALESISESLCTPFAAQRDGINIGEGAAAFVLTRSPLNAEKVCLSGVGEGSDAYHISSPEPQGLGAEKVMRAALNDADLRASDIAYVNLHGTATRKNDEMEARAVSRVFGYNTPCSSTKALTGHLLGAAGITEAVYSYLSLIDAQHRLPPQISTAYDSELPPIQLVSRGEIAANPIHHVMTCNYAFGGSNAALVLSREPT